MPGTGAVHDRELRPEPRDQLVRNPHFKEWSRTRSPTAIRTRSSSTFGLTVEAAVTEIENGQADWMLDPPPPTG